LKYLNLLISFYSSSIKLSFLTTHKKVTKSTHTTAIVNVKDKESMDGKKICHHAQMRRRKYEEADQRILNIVNRYDIGTAIEYLRGISHNFQII
jgi:hypothetical protein